jgi:ribA/ribD-fused uncharacterized protein
MEQKKTIIINENYIYFFGEKNDYGCFSQFYPCKFVYDCKIFMCCEQFMMYNKAILFGDIKIANKILQETSPKKIKSLGRKVCNFDENIWNENKEKIVFKGNFLKFTQNENLKRILIETQNKMLIEASPYDKIWGIGISKTQAINGVKWKGLNLLGNILMDVREKIISL